MKTRLWMGVGLLLVLAFGITATAWAGGWAVVTLDSLPATVRAGEPLTLGFMVRQHGETPTNSVKPYLSAKNQSTGEAVRFDARQNGPVGHFLVDVRFPADGTWTWSVTPAPFEATEFGTLTVLPAMGKTQGETQSAPIAQPATPALTTQTLLRWGGLLALLAALALAVTRTRTRSRTQPVAN